MNERGPDVRDDGGCTTAARAVIEHRSQVSRILLSILVVGALVAGYGAYRVADIFFIPLYGRSSHLDRVAWGNDGALYMLMSWVVFNRRTLEPLAVFNNVAYRLDADSRVLRRLPQDEGVQIVQRWPTVGWVGGRYMLITRKIRDPRTQLYRYPTDLYDWSSGETLAWTRGPIVAFSPDDRYLLWSDTTRHGLPVIHWMNSGRDVPVPDTVMVFRDYREETPVYRLTRLNLVSGETINLLAGNPILHLKRPLYPTTEGLLDPALKQILDPVTLDTRAGWELFPGIANRYDLSCDGRMLAILASYPSIGVVMLENAREVLRNGVLRHPNIMSLSLSSTEYAKWKPPETWQDVEGLPVDIPLPGGVP